MGSISTCEGAARGAHLVGSIPMADEEEIFKYASSKLGTHLKRIPDGEPRERFYFVVFQADAFAPCGKEVLADFASKPRHFEPEEAKRILDNLPEKIATTYDDAALASYAIFDKLQAAGTIPSTTRFQASLPTPINTLVCCVQNELMEGFYPLYERSLLADMARIQREIPHDKLAIQWDAAIEFSLLEDRFYEHSFGGITPQLWFQDVLAGLVERTVRCVDAVHDDVEVGLHLCYGDAGHEHFVQPKDLAWCVAFANGVMAKARRPLNWVHMPVPKDRDDDDFFVPLKELQIEADRTELYLGLVHAGDEEGTRRRIRAAGKFVGSFGVATECGMGRTSVEDMHSIFEVTATVAHPWT